jgi:chemotaxis protein methyltransferase CheR
MDERAFADLADLVRRRAGIALSFDKAHAVARRLAPVAHIFGFKDSAMLLSDLAHPHEELAGAVTEAITTQDTSFFRDPAVFEHLEQTMLPALARTCTRRTRLRIWSAGCATGQEAYSLAIALDRSNLGVSGWTVDLIATDLSGKAIARAKDGLYSSYEIQRGLHASDRTRYFVKGADGWRANERLRRAIAFRTFNLLDHFGWLGELDVAFCRNVLMYFTPEEKTAVLGKLARALRSGGYLVLGGSERAVDGALAFTPAPGPRGIFVKQA